MTRSNNLRSTLIKTGNLTSESSKTDVLEVLSDFSGASMATVSDACEGDEGAQQRVHDALFLSMRENCGEETGLFLYCQMTGMLEHMEAVGAIYAERLGL